MDGTYSHVLLVELQENNTSKLKNKLIKYFQSKKSNGGDCEVDYENGSRTAVLRFRREEDRQKVLAKETHEIVLDNGVLKMTVRLPEDRKSMQETPPDSVSEKSDVTDERTPAAKPQTEEDSRGAQTAEEELCSTSAVLGSVPDSVSQEFLEMLVENILKNSDSPSASQTYSLEVIPGLASAVVTFPGGKETTDFIKTCPNNKAFKKKGLSVRLLELTNQVLMEGTRNYSADLLHLYFENVGGDVETIVLNEEEQSAIITFKDHKDVQKTLKKKHHIQQEVISVFPFYKSLETALYGKDKPPIKLPHSISEGVDDVIARYLQASPSGLEAMRHDFAKHFCTIELQQSTVRLSPVPSLLQQKDVEALIKNWTRTVKSLLEQALSKFKCLKLNIEPGSWDESEENISQVLLNENVVVVPDKAQSILSVGGSEIDVNRLEQTLRDILDRIGKRLQREKMTITRKMTLLPSLYRLLFQDDFQDSLRSMCPELKMSFDNDSQHLTMSGLNEEIFTAADAIHDAKFSLKRQNLEIDNFVLEFLKNEQQEELTNALLTSRQVQAAFDISAQRIQLVAVTDGELKNAQDHLRSLLVSEYIDVEDGNVLKKPEWQQLVSHLKKVNNESFRKMCIQIKDQQVVVTGHKDAVERVSGELDYFLHQNAEVEEKVAIKPNIIVKYIEKHVTSWKEQVKDKAVVSFRKEVISLCGSRVSVADCKTLFEDLAANLFVEVLKVDKPGVKLLFQDKEATVVYSVINATGCLVQLVDEISGNGQDRNSQQTDSPQRASNVEQSQSPQAADSPTVKPAAVDPSCLAQFLTKEGLAIMLMTGNIGNATTAVTVNSVSEDLDLNKGAISTAIIRVAGPKLQQLVNDEKTSGNVEKVIVTDGCGLRSKRVFHAVVPHWDKGQGSAEKMLNDIISDCLNKAEDSGLNSITFPAIGTGNLGFPKHLAASIMFDKISTFSSKTQPKHLKTVVIVLYHGDALTIQAACDEFKKRFPTASATPASKCSGFFTGITSKPGMHESKMGNVTVQLVTGDITKETTDVIVNSSNEQFTLKSGVSKAIMDAAGQPIEAECQRLGAQSHNMIMTQPGNLKCKKILHVVGQTDPTKIETVVKNAIARCSKDSFTSVSFPAIGTGQGNVQARQVADAMLDAVVAALSKNPGSPLKTIRIVIFQQPMLKDFYDSMQQREASDQKQKGGSFWGNIGSKVKALFVTPDTQPQKGDFVIEPLKVDPTCFHICGHSQAKVDSAKQWITDFICKEQNRFCVTDDIIVSFTAADHQRLVDMQKSMAVSIKVECKMSKASLTVEGLIRDVLKASNEIHEMLKRVRHQEEMKEKLERFSAMVDWQYQQQGQQFTSFDSMANYQLERAREKNLPNIQVTVQGQMYTVTLPSGPAKDSQGGVMEIKRIDKRKDHDELPQTWDAMPDKKVCHTTTVQPGTTEHNDILKLFQASCNKNVLKIERIQNPTLWKSLQIKKSEMDLRNGHKNNERRLFHGTCPTTVAYINEHGFNRSYAGKNAACYGNGTYFAVNANYSAQDTYSKPDAQGQKCMYLCRVLTGDYTAGARNMIVPPNKSSSSVEQYNSVVDKPSNPSMFVIFHDSQAYPEYLITFK